MKLKASHIIQIWSLGIILAMLLFNIQPVLENMPWFQFTIGCNTFIFFLELYLDIRQSFTLRQYNDPNAIWTETKYHIQNILGLLNFSRTESTIGFIMECFVLHFGILVQIYQLNSFIWERLGFDSTFEITRGIGYLFLISLSSSLIRLPFEMYRIYIDQSPNISTTTTIKQTILDQIKMFVISLFIGIPMLTITLSLFYWQLPYQWFTICIFVSSVALLFSDMYPRIAFLFNSFSVLEEGELRSEIIQLSKKLNFPLQEIYTMDGSKRVAHSNAFLMGFWNSSFVLYDNLIKQLSTPEILAIIGHEIGHHKFKHTWKHLLIQLVFVSNFIYLFSGVVNLPIFYNSFGFSRIDVSVGLILFSYLYSTFANLLRFVTNLIQREFEFAADAYAIENGLDMKNALHSMHSTSSSVYIRPDKYFSIYYYTHPTLMERLDSIELLREEKINLQNKKVQ
ncbi:hypothetical protein DLAC_04301 [Tieghemostelium lacteum]|uniref:CAAX prenyl protease n=1 Tax=Tieghemostelium lacteum TaxID=361077 RepID=A0A151ZJ50_TIELA|nr:hypothetical protein DLAC_04301 [Tieghemostelium lacteum]|eukprot:KYQ94028.1 hypothetical protein DLAC_04301 [Tieghemostelium lacteum]